MSLLSRYRIGLMAISAAALLSACARQDPDELVASAQAQIDRQDLNAAIIELKNALEVRPDHAIARMMLGKALFESGQTTAAAVEFEKALELGLQPDVVIPLLAKARLRDEEFRKVVELDARSRLDSPDARASVKASLAQALAELGEEARAQQAVQQALEAVSDHPQALLFKARTLEVAGDEAGAAKVVADILHKHPDDPDARLARAHLLRTGGRDPAGAAAEARSVLARQPHNTAARSMLITILLESNDIAGAQEQLVELRNRASPAAQVAYIEARIAAQTGKLEVASEAINRALKVAPEGPQLLQLAGTIALMRGEHLLAEQHLSRLLTRLPSSIAARKLLARVYMRLGEPAKALAMIEQVSKRSSTEAGDLLLAGSAHLLLGDARQAEVQFAGAAKLEPRSTAARVGLAQTQVVRGDVTGGMKSLDAIAEADPDYTADFALISSLLAQRKTEAALKAIDRLAKKQPDLPQAPLLRAQALLSTGDAAGARAAFEKAVAIDASYLPAYDGLAMLDVREKNFDRARERYAGLLASRPRDVRIITAMAALDEQAGLPSQTVAAGYKKAVELQPSDAFARKQLISYHIRVSDIKAALGAAQAAAIALPNSLDMVSLLGEAQLRAGEIHQAVATLSRLVTLGPPTATAHAQLARAQIAAKAQAEAAESIRKALAVDPSSPQANELAVQLELLGGRFDKALAIARALKTRNPSSAQAMVLEGDIEVARRAWPAAIESYQAALERQPAGPVAQRLYAALRKSGRADQATAFASEWTRTHPDDIAFRINMAGWSIVDKKLDTAASQLQEAVQLAPGNAEALNNLAWVLATLKRPGAVSAAERALKLQQGRPEYLDTLSLALTSEGKLGRAIETQREAVELAPDRAAYRLRLTRLLLEAGDKSSARVEFEALSKMAAPGSPLGKEILALKAQFP